MDPGRSPSIFTEPLVWLKMTSPFYDTSKKEKEIIERTKWLDVHERGYRVWSFLVEVANTALTIQNIRRQSLAYGLWDSPLGLPAWIREKLSSRTDGYP